MNDRKIDKDGWAEFTRNIQARDRAERRALREPMMHRAYRYAVLFFMSLGIAFAIGASLLALSELLYSAMAAIGAFADQLAAPIDAPAIDTLGN